MFSGFKSRCTMFIECRYSCNSRAARKVHSYSQSYSVICIHDRSLFRCLFSQSLFCHLFSQSLFCHLLSQSYPVICFHNPYSVICLLRWLVFRLGVRTSATHISVAIWITSAPLGCSSESTNLLHTPNEDTQCNHTSQVAGSILANASEDEHSDRKSVFLRSYTR